MYSTGGFQRWPSSESFFPVLLSYCVFSYWIWVGPQILTKTDGCHIREFPRPNQRNPWGFQLNPFKLFFWGWALMATSLTAELPNPHGETKCGCSDQYFWWNSQLTAMVQLLLANPAQMSIWWTTWETPHKNSHPDLSSHRSVIG